MAPEEPSPTNHPTNSPAAPDAQDSAVSRLQAGPGTARRIQDLARAAEAEDGDPPFSDQTLVDVRSAEQPVEVVAAAHATGERPGLTAAAVLIGAGNGAPALLEAVVAPEARGHGLGRTVVQEALSAVEGPVDAWAHGDHAAARALAASLDFVPVRELHRLLRPLDDVAQELPVRLPEGIGLRSFEVGQDEDAWLEVNAAAFADHPEQGRMTLRDLQQRQAEDWFDPRGFLIAYPLENPREIAGFHWTKIHPATAHDPARGEVHVVGIAPGQQGKGLGKALTVAGLHYLAERGLGEVLLYVDGDNRPAMSLYRAIGFGPWHLDVMFSRR